MLSWDPHEYQLNAVQWLLTKPAAGLLLNPGMGKTSCTLAAIRILRDAKFIRKTLVIAPLRVAKMVWGTEAKKWTDFHDLRVVHLCEMPNERRAELLRSPYDIYVINPESLKYVLELMGDDMDTLVIDESTKFKDYSTQRFKLLKKQLPRFKRRYILTGTPAPNGIEDLFGQVYVLDEGKRLGRYITHFRQEFMIKDEWSDYKYTPAAGAAEVIYKRISDILMRIDPKDHLKMPQLINTYISVPLPPAAMKVYKQMENDLFTIIKEDPVFGVNAAVAGGKCRQIGNGFLYITDDSGERRVEELHDEKFKALDDLVEQTQGRPMFILYEFIADRERLLQRYPGAVDITSTKNLEKTIQDFNEGTLPILLAHPKSAGHGLNLQGSCDTVVWFGVTWDLELYEQAIARIWRQGNPNPAVVVHHIMADTPIDKRVIHSLEQKDFTQKSLMNALRRLAKHPESNAIGV
jgi:SNF2 family DNA or RNA helicase